jgi:hypothetical protein
MRLRKKKKKKNDEVIFYKKQKFSPSPKFRTSSLEGGSVHATLGPALRAFNNK